MSNQDFSITMLVDQRPAEVFQCINYVRGWWSEELEGNSVLLDDEFVYRHKPWHYSRQRIIESLPGKKIVWLVTDSELSFTKQKDEWTGTKIIFEIDTPGDKTEIRFTQEGLVPEIECYDSCTKGWYYYLQESLLPLIQTGKGLPDQKQRETPAAV